MRVVDITSFYHSESGGVKTYLHEKAAYWQARPDVEHTLVVPGPKDGISYVAGSRVISLRSPVVPGLAPYRLFVGRHRVRQVLERLAPDIIEVGSPYGLLGPAAAVREKLGSRVVGFFHSNFPRTYLRRLAAYLGRPAGEVGESLGWHYARALYNLCDLTLAPSAAMARELKEHGIQRVRHQSLGVNVELFHPRARRCEVRTQLGLREETLLLYVGRLAPEKDLPLLLTAFRLVEQAAPGRFHLLLVGTGPLRPLLEQKAKEHGGITLYGYRRGAELATLYASADLFVMPGAQETFGLTLLEAQAAGTPVVATAGGAAAEMVPPGAGYLVPPGAAHALAATLLAARADNLRARGRAARAYVEANYTWTAVLQELEIKYRELLGVAWSALRRTSAPTKAPTGQG